MIRLDYNNDQIVAIQSQTPPAVYLDHWALMDFSDSDQLAISFADILKRRQGTLVLSWLNLAEFMRVANQTHATNAERLLDRTSPNLFFLEPNVFEVIERENRILRGEAKLPPHADEQLLRAFVVRSPRTVDLLSGADYFSIVHSFDLQDGFARMADTIVARVTDLRNQYASDVSFRKKIDTPTTGPDIQCGTRYLMRDLLSLVLKNPSFVFDRNHAIDYMHTVVSVAYCDYVLLDSHWATQVEQSRTRLRNCGMVFPIAKVYSRRRGGSEQLLRELDEREF